MGFFKDINKLNKQAKEISKDYDPAAQMQQGMAQMQQANEWMAAQTAAAQAAATGTPVQLQVLSSRDTGTVMNLQPVLAIELLVTPGGGAPYPVTVQQVVPVASLSRLAPGATLAGKADAQDPQSIWIDWS